MRRRPLTRKQIAGRVVAGAFLLLGALHACRMMSEDEQEAPRTKRTHTYSQRLAFMAPTIAEHNKIEREKEKRRDGTARK